MGDTRLVISDLNGDGCIDPLSDPSGVLQENHYYPFGLNMEGPWAAQYQKDENGETVLDEEGNPVVDQEKLNRYQYNGKELTEDLGLNWNDYGARWYDASIARFPSIDRFSENYYSMTPYQYAGNSPIVNIDVNGDSIKTYFYDRDGNQVSQVPAAVQQMFNSEYGISVAYNPATNMLYKSGDVTTDNTVSAPGLAIVEGVLGENNARTRLVFGYNLHVKGAGEAYDNEAVGWGGTTDDYGNGALSLIDLADFNSDGSLKYHTTNDEFDSRSMNIGRAFEHEFFGHGEKNHGGKKFDENFRNVPYINATFRTPAGIPERDQYTDNYAGGGSMYFPPNKNLRKKGKKINFKKMFK